PVVTAYPLITVLQSAATQFFIPAIDPDGDPMRFRIATDQEAVGGTAPNSITSDPVTGSPPGISISPNTGVVVWDNRGLDTSAPYTVQVIVEDLDAQGNVKTQTPVDIRLRVYNQKDRFP